MNAHPDPIVFLPLTRSMRVRIEATIEQLLALLDEIDGDPDLEAANDDDRELEDEHDEDGFDLEPDCDDEPDEC